MPSPFEASAGQIENLDRANMYRDLAGLPRLVPHRALNLAAQNHADYAAAHNEGHSETYGQSGFTGAQPGDRCRYTGYAFSSFEVMAFGGGSRTSPGWGVDMWIGSVYHRLPFMSYRSTQVGAGVSGTTMRTVGMNFGSFGAGAPAERLLAT